MTVTDKFPEVQTARSNRRTAPTSFKNPHSIGNKLGRLLWNWVYYSLYRWTPPRLGMVVRRQILRMFGARLGACWIHPSTRIWAPWKLEIGHDVYVDAHCNLYNAYGIKLGDRTMISFGTTLCTASHDYQNPTYPLIGKSIHIENDSWVAAEAFLGPGVTIGEGAIVGSRSVVFRNVDSWTIVAGNPARRVKTRLLSPISEQEEKSQ